jgi:putative ABC transport system permease protein
MGAVVLVVRRRLAGRWRALLAIGMLLGIGFGASLASFGAARRTASAYDRILAASHAPDAAVALGGPLEESERSLQRVPGVVHQRVYAGYLGGADAVDPVYTTALLAATNDQFPVELPAVQTGRLPDPNAPDEVFMNAAAAAGAGLEIGQRLHFTFYTASSTADVKATVTIVGTGTFPMEIARDETSVLGLVVFTRAFYDAHRDLVVYAVSNVDLAPGVDARTDLAPAATKLGHDLQSARSQERQSVNEALRPLVVALVALGLLALAATAVGVAQVMQRDRDRWRGDSQNLLRIGMVRGQLRALQLATAAVVAALTVVIALVVMLLSSPLAPIGLLHDFDPARGLSFDFALAALGVAVIVGTIALAAIAFSPLPAHAIRPEPRRALWLTSSVQSPSALAGLTLALRAEGGRIRTWRGVAATMLAATLLGIAVASVTSAVMLTATPARYGFDADLVALNQYGDQPVPALTKAFAADPDVAAATGFTSGTFLVNGRAVPGLAATVVKGELTPTILHGRPARTAGEMVVGQDTLGSLGAKIGDVLPVQLAPAAGTGRGGKAPAHAIGLRIVGVATFPPVNQAGSDMPRLGIGVLVTRDAFIGLRGSADNLPELTIVKVVRGADPASVIARNRTGFTDATRSHTRWFTGTKPAELRQLDAAMPYLRGALVFGYVILFAVITHALWTRVRSSRRSLAILRALGSTRRQLDTVTVWQVAPFALATLAIGLPLGIVIGRRVFTLFAHSLAVVDDATTSVRALGLLSVTTLAAIAVATLVSVVMARRTRGAIDLRQE